MKSVAWSMALMLGAALCADASPLTFDFPALSRRVHVAPAASVAPPLKPAPPSPLYVVHPMFDQLDGAFAVGSNQCGVLVFAVRRDPVPPACADLFDARRVVFRLDVPAGYEFVDATCAAPDTVQRTTLSNGVQAVSFRLRSAFYAPSPARAGGRRFGVMLRSFAPTSNAVLRVTAGTDDAAAPAPVPCEVRLLPMPPVRAVAPRTFAFGVYPEARCYNFPTVRANRLFAEFLRDAGVTWIIPSFPPDTLNGSAADLIALWRQHGIRRITPDASMFLANGYQAVSDITPRAEDCFVAADGQPLGRDVLCPAAIYEERPVFAQGVLPNLKTLLAECDGIWCNWEPFVYRTKGCFCSGCRRRFAAFAGVAEDVLAEEWPAGLLPGGRFFEAACRFRSAEHGKVVQTIARHVMAMTSTTNACGFIPGICWSEVSPGWQTRWYSSEARADAFMPALTWVNPFGPYIRWDRTKPYDGVDGQTVSTLLVAEAVRRQVDADYPPAGSRRLLAFPYGLIGSDWLAQPEWLRIAAAASFFAGWDAVVPWRYPEGADARYWAAFAEAAAWAAAAEDALMDARPVADVLAHPVAPVPTRPSLDIWYLPRGPVPLFQQRVFASPTRRVLVVFNFSDTQTVAFTVDSPAYPGVHHLPPCSVRVFTIQSAPSKTSSGGGLAGVL